MTLKPVPSKGESADLKPPEPSHFSAFGSEKVLKSFEGAGEGFQICTFPLVTTPFKLMYILKLL